MNFRNLNLNFRYANIILTISGLNGQLFIDKLNISQRSYYIIICPIQDLEPGFLHGKPASKSRIQETSRSTLPHVQKQDQSTGQNV